jgi:ribonuclease-3
MLVNEGHLAEMANKISLGSYLCLGKGEDSSNGRNKPSILSCTYEAVVGAIFNDGGYGAAAEFVSRHFVPCLDTQKDRMHLTDAKSRLQELTQEKYNEAPVYVLESSEGPDHQKIFTVSVCFRGNVLAYGKAKSKKEAEQMAAADALARFSELDISCQT